MELDTHVEPQVTTFCLPQDCSDLPICYRAKNVLYNVRDKLTCFFLLFHKFLACHVLGVTVQAIFRFMGFMDFPEVEIKNIGTWQSIDYSGRD